MRRDLRSGCSPLLIGLFLALLQSGCTTPGQSRWVDPDTVLISSSERQIVDEFQRLFAQYRNGHERFSMAKVPTTNPRFAFVTAFPYRGPNIFSIYCFEQTTLDAWQLRAVIPVIEAQNATPRFVSDGGGVKIVVDGRTILTLDRLGVAPQAVAK